MHSCKSTLRLRLGKLLVRHQMKVHLSHLMVLRQSAVTANNPGLQVAPMLPCITAMTGKGSHCMHCSVNMLLETKILSAAYSLPVLLSICIYTLHYMLQYSLYASFSTNL